MLRTNPREWTSGILSEKTPRVSYKFLVGRRDRMTRLLEICVYFYVETYQVSCATSRDSSAIWRHIFMLNFEIYRFLHDPGPRTP